MHSPLAPFNPLLTIGCCVCSLVFSAILLSRLTTPLCLNFLSMAHLDNHVTAGVITQVRVRTCVRVCVRVCARVCARMCQWFCVTNSPNLNPTPQLTISP